MQINERDLAFLVEDVARLANRAGAGWPAVNVTDVAVTMRFERIPARLTFTASVRRPGDAAPLASSEPAGDVDGALRSVAARLQAHAEERARTERDTRGPARRA
jgi:hypothetical protein